jgi:hypothetical protein
MIYSMHQISRADGWFTNQCRCIRLMFPSAYIPYHVITNQ